MSFSRHYQRELLNLKELAVEFSKAHPALAPMLSGQTPDPDVERLLEGTAFLTGLLREKLEDEFPEIIHGLMDLIFPHYLRPIPSATLISFMPKPSLKESLKVPSGVQIGSVPLDGTTCLFRTCYDLDLHPLRITAAEYLQRPGSPPRIRLALELTGMPLSAWRPQGLRFYLAESYPDAADLYLLLNRQVKTITFRSAAGGAPATLPSTALAPGGFSAQESLLSYPRQSFPGYRILQEYFVLPEKFLFLELRGWEAWTDRGNGSAFEISFELAQSAHTPPRIRPESFMLFVSPAVNLFSHDADPVVVDHRQPEYRVRPTDRIGGHYEVHSLDRVVGMVQGSVEQRDYVPFEFFGHHEQERPIYAVARRKSPVTQALDLYLSLTYPPSSDFNSQETLSISLTCTNGTLPERLQLGDISQTTSSSPELAEFRNILAPTAQIHPPVGSDALWHFLSHLSLNYLSVASVDTIKELLGIYVFPEGRDRAKTAANTKRVEGIQDLQVKPVDRLVSGHMMRGREIRMKLRQDHFASPGDLFLFGTVMDYFFAVYSSINAFTRLFVEESITGETYAWPPRLGERFLV
ncbi:MAG: type VI secretion system baseplate subunit TssF [Deltaproteobacteria bacterium]|nr:type VI secretion system baseplate subunit TssF [Deltaproteobacteria bacterium]